MNPLAIPTSGHAARHNATGAVIGTLCGATKPYPRDKNRPFQITCPKCKELT